MLIPLSEPAGAAVDIAALKLALRVDGVADDAKLAAMLAGQTGRYEHFTGRIMAPQDFELQLPRWQRRFDLPVFPVRALIEVAYLDRDDVEQPVGGFAELVDARHGKAVFFSDEFFGPALSDQPLPIRVRFSAGYDLPGTAVTDPALVAPAADREAIKLMVQSIFDHDKPLTDPQLIGMFGHRRRLL